MADHLSLTDVSHMKMKFTKIAYTLLAASIILAGASSCTREFTCQCYISYSGQPGLPDTTLREYTITDTKKNAEKLCQEHSGTYESGGIRTVETCDLW